MRFGLMITALLLLNLLGTVFVKLVGGERWSYGVLGLLLIGLFGSYLGRVVLWMLIGRRYQLTYAYPFISVNYVFSFLLGMWAFNERFELNRCLGAACIMLGVLTLSRTMQQKDGDHDPV